VAVKSTRVVVTFVFEPGELVRPLISAFAALASAFAGLTLLALDAFAGAPVAFTVEPFTLEPFTVEALGALPLGGCVFAIVGLAAAVGFGGFAGGFAASVAATALTSASATRIVSRRMMPPGVTRGKGRTGIRNL
jgi:hypothetical protein